MSDQSAPESDKKDDREPKAASEFAHSSNSSSASSVGRDVNNVQADTINGGVFFGVARTRAPLVLSRVTEAEKAEVREQFVVPSSFGDAQRSLWECRVVLLCGRGCGRTYTARKLLVESGATTIAELNPDRRLDSVTADELEADGGYVWEADGSVARPLTDRDFTTIVKVMRDLGSRLVIVLGEASQTPGAAVGCAVTLTAPPAAAVGRSQLRWRCPGDMDAEDAFTAQLADCLAPGDPPAKAVRAADLALRIVEKAVTPEDAVTQLREDTRDAVRRWARDKSIIDFVMSIAIAVLENQPYNEVEGHVLDLDRRVREAQLRPGEALRPRRVFGSPRATLLDDNNATVVLRNHPVHKGLHVETVNFQRQDWAKSVLHHVWLQYPIAHRLVRDWMCSHTMLSRFPEPARRALCTIIAEVPAYEPLRWVDELAESRNRDHRLMAAAVLERLADEHRMDLLTQQVLDDWVTKGTVRRQWTAALVYGSAIGRRDLSNALAKLERIAKSKWDTPLYGVLSGVLLLLAEQDCRQAVLDRLVSWTEPVGSHPGPCQVAYRATLYATGFLPASGIDPGELEHGFPVQLHRLVRRTLLDLDAGPPAVDLLYEMAKDAAASERAATALVRIALLVLPDLTWWRFGGLLPLLRAHPRKASIILWIFQVARRTERDWRKKAAAAASEVA